MEALEQAQFAYVAAAHALRDEARRAFTAGLSPQQVAFLMNTITFDAGPALKEIIAAAEAWAEEYRSQHAL